MEIDIIKLIERDLHIMKCSSETEIQYKARIIYTAMTLWIKTSVLDTNLVDNINSNASSKKHVLERCTQILDEILLLEPTIRPWFYDVYENSKSKSTAIPPIKVIRNTMMRSGEIIETGFNTDVAIPDSKIIPVFENISRIFGIPSSTYPIDSKSAGVTWIIANINNNSIQYSHQESASSWSELFFKKIKWENSLNNDNKEYFNPTKYEATMYRCWGPESNNSYKGYTLSRKDMGNNIYEYYIEKKSENETLISKIDEYYIERYEQRRLQYGLRKLAGNPSRAYYRKEDGFVVLTLFARLPQQEGTLLYTYGWPQRNLDDSLHWLFIEEVWPIIYDALLNLNIEILEDQHG